MTNLFVGIDISMKDFKVQLMNDTGETVAKRRRFLNDQPGLDSLVELILTTCQTNNIDRVYAGLTWRGRQSGEFEADETPLTKTGNAYLRYYFVQAANQVRQHEPEYRQFYARKYRESKTHHHRRALVLTARKLVRMVDALLRSNQLYMPQGQRSDSA